MSARTRDLASYSGAWLVFVVVGLASAPSVAAEPQAHLPLVLGAALWVVHFWRRTAECAWLHRYGGRCVSASEALQEFAYYWVFSAANAHALASRPNPAPALLLMPGLLLFWAGAAGNTWAHWKLRNLRPPGTAERGLPRGGAFEWVSCPHYLFEAIIWIGFALVAETWPASAFAVVVGGLLAVWANRRHQRYRREFDGRDGRDIYPPDRKALIPFVF